ncbi:MAG: putative transcriptional regulatory protein Crp/Fnr family, partial [Rubritepida sp.]|nr:putative transcriptional regulatory protein Crp/Fnr family [Rubritepida sp.]
MGLVNGYQAYCGMMRMIENRLIRKLQNYVRFSEIEEIELERLVSENQFVVPPREDIVPQGSRPDFHHIVVDGWACHYKDLVNGRRQITAFCLPGDLCTDSVSLLRHTSHSVGSLTSVRIAQVSSSTMQEVTAIYPR